MMNKNLFNMFGRLVNLRNCVRTSSLFLLVACMLFVQVSAASGGLDTTTGVDLDKALYKTGAYTLDDATAKGTIRFEELCLRGYSQLELTGPISSKLCFDTVSSTTLDLHSDLVLGLGASIVTTGTGGYDFTLRNSQVKGNYLFLDDIGLPDRQIYIDGWIAMIGCGTAFSFEPNTSFCGTGSLFLKKLIIGGLSSECHFRTTGYLGFIDCEFVVAPGETWTIDRTTHPLKFMGYNTIRGGGTVRIKGLTSDYVAILSQSTLVIDRDTTLEIAGKGLSLSSGGTLFFNGGNLKVSEDHTLNDGQLVFADNCTWSGDKTLTLGEDLDVRVLAGARVNVTNTATNSIILN